MHNVQKGCKVLDEHDVNYESIDIVQHTPTKKIQNIVDKTGVNINKLFNTHGIKYRELNLKICLMMKTRTTCFRWNVG